MDAWFRTGYCRKTKLSSDEGTSSSGTTSSEIVGEPMPQYVIFFETLFNKCMKFSKFERHLSTKHPECVEKSLDFFQIKKKKIFLLLNQSWKIFKTKHIQYPSLLIAKKGSAHTVGEEFIIPAVKIISNTLFDEECTNKINNKNNKHIAFNKINEIPLSNTTVKRRIDEMLENVKIAIITVLKQSEYFSLQLEESTDVAGQANLLAFVRFKLNGNIEEEMLFCQSLSTKTTGEEIFKSVDSFIKESEVDWFNIHREALAVKGLDECLKNTLNGAVKIVNFIKAKPKNSRLFGVLCNKMGSEHKQLLLHCEVRWLSIGNLAYLADIFVALNVLNLTLQGKDVHKFFVQDKVYAIIFKL
ncbi:Hypothetical protein CINCED_3A010039 [Cinara cedri]|uniref:Uncharacterized protein n=1 Tax=Cinara cedri TaxID=506608 RepID=A0A5E4NKV4_9HEMI|nr:Hypothetical protein CINCED_3A010039 [Cinara cedri]